MKFARIQVDGQSQWAVVEGETIRRLEGTPFGDHNVTGDNCSVDEVRLLPPVKPSKIYCLGRNYAEHIREMGYEQQDAPSVFMKGLSTIIGPGEDVILPPLSMDPYVEHEAELAVVIGRPARFIRSADASDYVLGYTCANDVSARTLQRNDPHPTRGKGFDTFCPVGPWIETDVDPADNLAVRCRVNSELRQDGTTGQMIHRVPELIEYLSGFATLLPGDLILTGSPGGSAQILPGDRVEIEIEGIGVLTHGVLSADRT